jgi:predicted GH43/DUF377 family glycosyl hydrolase
MSEGGIYYSESTDGKTITEKKPTGIKEQENKMISNPAVLMIEEGNWIMIYEMAPLRRQGEKEGPPGPATQRNLYLATSNDGRSFSASGIAIDSSKEDDYFASVPDLIKLEDGRIRVYYVSNGLAIGSAISNDKGKTWTRESGYRLEGMAVDPDVLYKDGKWVMYYSILDPSRNAMYKATSNDGLFWNNETKIFSATTGGAIVDADVFGTQPNKYLMLFGQSQSGGSTGGETIDLYLAISDGDIF